MPPLLTLIVRHRRKTRANARFCRCAAATTCAFSRFPVKQPPDLSGYIRLSAEGLPLTEADRGSGLLLLDGSWRWAAAMTKTFEHVPSRSLTGYRTAYPRVSKQGTDPDNGLATVEALYIAHTILGRDTEGLLDHYHWAAEFLELNGFSVKK